MSVPHRRQRLPSRSALTAGLLVLSLGVAGVLAYQAVDATRSHERIARETAREHARFATWQLSTVIRREVYARLLGPGLDVVGRSGGAYTNVRLKPWPAVQRSARDHGWDIEGLDYIFRYNFATKHFETRGAAAPDETTKAWLISRVQEQEERLLAGRNGDPWVMTSLGTGEEERLLVYTVNSELEDEGQTGFGFQMRPSVLTGILSSIAKTTPLLPPALTNGAPNSAILSFRVRDGSGRDVYQTVPQYTGDFTAEDTVGTLYGGLGVAVTLRPELVDELVIGGLPRSRLPVIFGLLAVTAALILAAILQIRREQELARLREDFVSSVSHQLRTPLAQIRMFGETLLLGRTRSEEERQRSLEVIVRESRHLAHQVDNVLLLSRSQREDFRLHSVETRLAPLIGEILEGFRPLAEGRESRVESAIEDDLLAVADPSSVRQILINLLENAVKYGPRGQIVDVTLRRGPGGVAHILVEDEGQGIPEDQREAVFSPYYRLDRARDSGVAGSGIGLAVARDLAARQGGSVWVEEAGTGGARFVVELSLAPEH
jgi:signal transduction histidine kinase